MPYIIQINKIAIPKNPMQQNGSLQIEPNKDIFIRHFVIKVAFSEKRGLSNDI
jgi:hypothetical protein